MLFFKCIYHLVLLIESAHISAFTQLYELSKKVFGLLYNEVDIRKLLHGIAVNKLSLVILGVK